MSTGSVLSLGRMGRVRITDIAGGASLAAELVLAAWIGLICARIIWLIAFGAGAVDLTINPPAGPAASFSAPQANLRPDGGVLFADRSFGSGTETAEAAPATQLDITLHGVRLSSEAGGGNAIIRADGLEHRSYRAGDEIVAGVTLAAIHADRVTIRRQGVEESVFLREDAARGPTVIQASPALSPTAIRFAPELRDGRLTGFRITAGSDAAVLTRAGLQVGDVVTRVDGQAIGEATDMSRLLSELQSAASVTLDIERGGRPMSLETRLR